MEEVIGPRGGEGWRGGYQSGGGGGRRFGDVLVHEQEIVDPAHVGLADVADDPFHERPAGAQQVRNPHLADGRQVEGGDVVLEANGLCTPGMGTE